MRRLMRSENAGSCNYRADKHGRSFSRPPSADRIGSYAGISSGHRNLTETAMLLARLIWLLVMLAAALSPFFGEPDE